MSRKHIGRNAWRSGRIDASEPEIDELGVNVGDAVEVDVVDASDVARALVDSEGSGELLVVTPA